MNQCNKAKNSSMKFSDLHICAHYLKRGILIQSPLELTSIFPSWKLISSTIYEFLPSLLTYVKMKNSRRAVPWNMILALSQAGCSFFKMATSNCLSWKSIKTNKRLVSFLIINGKNPDIAGCDQNPWVFLAFFHPWITRDGQMEVRSEIYTQQYI